MGTFVPHFSRNYVAADGCFWGNNPVVVGDTLDAGLLGRAGLLKAPEDAAEESEDTAGVALGGGEAAQKQAEVVAVGRLHGAGGVASGEHGLLDDAGEQVESARGCGGLLIGG